MVHEVYDSLFFSSNFLFPLEGKCHVVAKGCTGLSSDVILYRYPDCRECKILCLNSIPVNKPGIFDPVNVREDGRIVQKANYSAIGVSKVSVFDTIER